MDPSPAPVNGIRLPDPQIQVSSRLHRRCDPAPDANALRPFKPKFNLLRESADHGQVVGFHSDIQAVPFADVLTVDLDREGMG